MEREARSDGVKVSTAGSATGSRGMYIVQYVCTTAHAFAIDDRTFPTSEKMLADVLLQVPDSVPLQIAQAEVRHHTAKRFARGAGGVHVVAGCSKTSTSLERTNQ